MRTYEEAVDFVLGVVGKKDPTFERITKALSCLENPEKDLKIIHIAGTNGKGSVCKMVFTVLKEARKKVGCYTSPHLVDIRERFVTQKGYVSQEDFIQYVEKISVLGTDFSYAETCILITILHCVKQKTEYLVLEVGHGGLLDATNFVTPIITAITSISFDHMQSLGDTLEQISAHKAGIIKPGVPIVYNHENRVIEEVARRKKAPIMYTSKIVQTNLVGKYQKKNAGIAFEICHYILGKDSENIILKGLQNVEHFGRLQYISKNLLIDGAHNIAGLEELFGYIQSIRDQYKKVYLCIAQKKGKEATDILNVFGNKYFDYILVKSDNLSMVEDPYLLREKINDYCLSTEGFSPLCGVDTGGFSSLCGVDTGGFSSLSIKTPTEIFDQSCQNPDTLFVVFGSLYMIGDFLKFVSK